MPEKRSAKLNCRIPQKLKDDLDALYENYRVEATAAVEDALMALFEYVEREGYYRRPMMMVAKESLTFVAEGGELPAASVVERAVERALRQHFPHGISPATGLGKPPAEPESGSGKRG